MARIAGIDLPSSKRVEIGLTYIFGIGRASAGRILAETGIDYSAMMGSSDNLDLAGIALPPVVKVGIFPGNLVIIAVAAVIATLMSGLYPAWKAGHVEPVESIKLV